MSAASALARLNSAGWIAVILLAALAAAFSVHMWPQWVHNPDLSHGLFSPVLFVLLLREGFRLGPARHLPASAGLTLARGVLLVLGIVLVVVAGLYAVAIDWSHSLVSLSLALALSALMLAALLWLSSGRVRVLPFNWTTFVAAGLWTLCAPVPPGTYARLTQHLQLWITEIVLGSLNLLGIPAARFGNVIQLAHTSVGVEEACSGVRSLVSCIVAAVFFSAAVVRRPWARVLLVTLAPFLAFGMNIVRSVTLTLLANGGTDISGAWHDLTGYAVLGVTAAILGALAFQLEDRAAPAPPDPAPSGAPAAPRPWGLAAACAVAAAMIGFFVFNTHGPARAPGPAPDLDALLPKTPAGWDVVQTADLYRFTSVLETDRLVQRTYVRRRPGSTQPLVVTVYIAYWSPGQVPVSLVASHTPEACWPGSGWVAEPVAPPPSPFVAGGAAVSAPQYRRFVNAGFPQNVWYWHLHDGRSIAGVALADSAPALLRLAWNYGFHSDGEQFFVRISSDCPWSEIAGDPLIANLVASLRPYGL